MWKYPHTAGSFGKILRLSQLHLNGHSQVYRCFQPNLMIMECYLDFALDRSISPSILSDRWADDQPGEGECITTGTVDWFSQDCNTLAHFVCECK